jgi:hypothetical protein
LLYLLASQHESTTGPGAKEGWMGLNSWDQRTAGQHKKNEIDTKATKKK